MLQSIKEIYESYRDHMAATLALEEWAPEKFSDPEFVRKFEKKVEALDTLIALYADLLSMDKN